MDNRGLGDAGAGCPELVPALPDYRGLRFNFQGPTATGFSNLQTLLSVDYVIPAVPTEMLQQPTPETGRQHGRMVGERLRRR